MFLLKEILEKYNLFILSLEMLNQVYFGVLMCCCLKVLKISLLATYFHINKVVRITTDYT